jgi:hypothetical protein
LRFDRRAALDELLGESPVAAAHVEPPLARGGRQLIEEDLPHELAPGAHHALVGCSIIEPNGLLCHWRRPSLITPFSVPRDIDLKDEGAPGTPRRLGGRVALGRLVTLVRGRGRSIISTSREWLYRVDSGPPDLAARDARMAKNGRLLPNRGCMSAQ